MLFKAEYALRGLDIAEGEQIELRQPDPPVMLVLHRPAKGSSSVKDGDCVCIVSAEKALTPNVDSHLKAEYEKEQNRKPFEEPQIHPAVRDLGKEMGGRISNFMRRAVAVYQWRKAHVCEEDPVRNTKGLVWSENGTDWKLVPGSIRTEFSIGHPAKIMSEELAKSYKEMVEGGSEEPIGHELLREAWQSRDDHPRTSMITCITAAEVGFKAFVGDLVPQAEWLALHVPTPPLEKMLAEYLPTLPARLTLGVPPFVPPEILAVIKKGVRLRNEATHAGKDVPDHTLREVLGVVRDLLYLLDFYAGQSWALEHISVETTGQIKAYVEKQKQSKK